MVLVGGGGGVCTDFGSFHEERYVILPGFCCILAVTYFVNITLSASS